MSSTRRKAPRKITSGRTLSSRLWLERQHTDPYVVRARREGLRARAAFKLMQIDDKQHVLRPGARVVDLGAAPGSWSQVAAEFAREVLAPGGAFLCKVLQGGTEARLLSVLKRDFTSVRHIKPPASRAESAELYLLATGFRG